MSPLTPASCTRWQLSLECHLDERSSLADTLALRANCPCQTCLRNDAVPGSVTFHAILGFWQGSPILFFNYHLGMGSSLHYN
jgi:hypothetical protein